MNHSTHANHTLKFLAAVSSNLVSLCLHRKPVATTTIMVNIQRTPPTTPPMVAAVLPTSSLSLFNVVIGVSLSRRCTYPGSSPGQVVAWCDVGKLMVHTLVSL